MLTSWISIECSIVVYVVPDVLTDRRHKYGQTLPPTLRMSPRKLRGVDLFYAEEVPPPPKKKNSYDNRHVFLGSLAKFFSLSLLVY